MRDNRGNLGGGCERREPFAITLSIAPPPTIEIAMLDIAIGGEEEVAAITVTVMSLRWLQ